MLGDGSKVRSVHFRQLTAEARHTKICEPKLCPNVFQELRTCQIGIEILLSRVHSQHQLARGRHKKMSECCDICFMGHMGQKFDGVIHFYICSKFKSMPAQNSLYFEIQIFPKYAFVI